MHQNVAGPGKVIMLSGPQILTNVYERMSSCFYWRKCLWSYFLSQEEHTCNPHPAKRPPDIGPMQGWNKQARPMWTVGHIHQQYYEGGLVSSYSNSRIIIFSLCSPSPVGFLFQIVLSEWAVPGHVPGWSGLWITPSPFVISTFLSFLRLTGQVAFKYLSNCKHGEQNSEVEKNWLILFLTNNIWFICYQQKLLNQTEIPNFRRISLTEIFPNPKTSLLLRSDISFIYPSSYSQDIRPEAKRVMTFCIHKFSFRSFRS